VSSSGWTGTRSGRTNATEDQYQDAGYLYLTLRTAECAKSKSPEPFEPGGTGGLDERRDELDLREVLVGDTAVEVDTSLTDDELDAVLASLAPVDVETLITAAAAPVPEPPS
jgi:hypothetical protein